MRPRYPTLISLLLACGPIAPSPAGGTTGEQITTTAPTSTTAPPDPTTVTPTTITTPTTTLDETTTTIDPTTSSGATLPGFLIPPDVGGGSTIECDIFQQDCAPGEKCVPWAQGGNAWNATKCVEVTGDGQPGDPCTAPEGPGAGIDDCGSDSICWDVDAANHGTCVAQCTGTPDAPHCAQNFLCSLADDGVLFLCIPPCDPLLPDCPGTKLCIPYNDSFICVLDASGDEGQTNDPCEFANACDPGLICLNTATASAACDQGSLGCCQPFCKFPNSPCPNPDQQCLQWFDPMIPIPPGSEDIGVCGIPF